MTRVSLSSVHVWQKAELLAVAEHLACEIVRICHLHPSDVAVRVARGIHLRVDEAAVWSDTQDRHAVEDFLVLLLIHLHTVAFHECLGGIVVALGLDALHLAEQLPNNSRKRS